MVANRYCYFLNKMKKFLCKFRGKIIAKKISKCCNNAKVNIYSCVLFEKCSIRPGCIGKEIKKCYSCKFRNS